MLLDYCPGGDLGQIMLKSKRMQENYVRIYASEITLAIGCLHAHSIVYRDLKPENVVLDKDGHCLLTDFGLSKQGINDNISRSFCGSIAYMAPEILNRSGHNRTVDWYLLGVMLYELLTGRPPYYNPYKEKLFKNILNAKLKFKRGISKEAKDLITRVFHF
jgi:serine/threonine protein kinase